MTEFSKVVGYKINIQKSIVFYTPIIIYIKRKAKKYKDK